MKSVFHFLHNDEFARNVIKLSSSSVFSSLFIFITLPIVTSLFTVSQLGEYQLLVSIITIFGVVASLKYEMAIVLPKDDETAMKVYKLCLYVLLIFCSLICFILFFFNHISTELVNSYSIKDFFWFIPVGIFFFGLFEVVKYGLMRKKLFTEFSLGRLYQVVSTQSSMIVFGLINPNIVSLFFSYIIGLSTASFIYLKKSFIFTRPKSEDSLKKIAIKYKKFPIFNSLMVFLNTLSNELPVFFLAQFFSSDKLGLYMLANRLCVIPMNFIGTAIGKVYFQKASEIFNINKQSLLSTYIETTKKLIFIGSIPFIAILVFSPMLIEIIFGEEWIGSALIMQIISISLFFKFITSPIGTTFTVINKQEIAFYLTLLSLIFRFIFMFYFKYSLVSLIWALTVSTSIYYVLYHLLIFISVKKVTRTH